MLTLWLSTPAVAQQFDKIKFGKISDYERDLAVVPGDSTADAYVLYHHQDLSFNYLEDKGIVSQEEHHRRIKLIKPSSFDRANIEITFSEKHADVSGLRAYIHLPNGDKEKLKGKDFIRQKLNDDYNVIKFTFPRVEPGAVVEYEYTLQTSSLLVPTPFVFQENIPVAYAEYTANIPEYFNYISLGTHGNFTVSETETNLQHFGPRQHQTANSGDSRIPHQWTRYVMENIPAYEVQPYTNNAQDYLPKVKLQLRTVQFPNSPIDYVLRDWFATAEELDGMSSFGKCYQASGASNKLWEAAGPVVMAGKTDKERIDRAYYYICKNLEWNREYSFLASDNPDNVFKNGGGNSADLNLCLLSLLRRAGIGAYPALVSLRDEGNHIEVYPIIDQFDHTLVYTQVNGRPYILDANGTARPPGLPRIDALNHRAWIARPGAPQWIALEMPPAKQIVMADIKITATGMAEAKIKTRLSSYFAFEGRYQAHSSAELSQMPVASDILSVFPEARVVEHHSEDDANPSKPLSSDFTMEIPAAVAADDYIYVQPILLRLLDKDLDDVETRIYPVDFAHPWKKQFIANLTLPEGYVVDELPGSIKLVSEDGGMDATYSATVKADHTITVRLAVNLDRTVYPASAYPALRGMYRRIIELQEAPIVLKRAK
ncbi:MAG: DUF3857 domain-containing protein [Lewinella sp.]